MKLTQGQLETLNGILHSCGVEAACQHLRELAGKTCVTCRHGVETLDEGCYGMCDFMGAEQTIWTRDHSCEHHAT